MKRVRIVVTQEHIDNGYTSSVKYCPIALALTDNYSDVIVLSDCISITHNKQELNSWYDLSSRAQVFINCFDEDKPVKPSVFYAYR